ncbi:MAG: hypothetical protein Q7K13_07225 [Polynucleobacter sp.]|nr:hypothetical protein [Polynucleobacter sp.]
MRMISFPWTTLLGETLSVQGSFNTAEAYSLSAIHKLLVNDLSAAMMFLPLNYDVMHNLWL